MKALVMLGPLRQRNGSPVVSRHSHRRSLPHEAARRYTGAAVLGRALSKNTSLQRLDLRWNKLSDKVKEDVASKAAGKLELQL